jgi:hypothetical protein
VPFVHATHARLSAKYFQQFPSPYGCTAVHSSASVNLTSSETGPKQASDGCSDKGQAVTDENCTELPNVEARGVFGGPMPLHGSAALPVRPCAAMEAPLRRCTLCSTTVASDLPPGDHGLLADPSAARIGPSPGSGVANSGSLSEQLATAASRLPHSVRPDTNPPQRSHVGLMCGPSALSKSNHHFSKSSFPCELPCRNGHCQVLLPIRPCCGHACSNNPHLTPH